MEHKQAANEITCKNAFRKLPKRIGPYQYDMNIYRGCAHRCVYCYALYSQRYLDQSDFYHDIYVKTNIAQQLKRQLASPHWHRQLINIGSVCDSYQPLEASYGLMREVLQVLIQYRNPCIISTKSALILRDLDLIDALSKLTYVNIAVTITTPNEKLARLLEPNAATSKRRGEVLSIIKEKTHAITGIHVMPIMPYLNDDEATLRELCDCVKRVHGDYATFGLLHLKTDTKRSFFQMLEAYAPKLVQPYQSLYRSGRIDPVYAHDFYRRLALITQEYHVNTDFMQYVKAYERSLSVEQLSLW